MLKVAIGQMEVIPGRPDLNTDVMLTMIAEARMQKADLIIFPEMAIPGYLLGDTWEQRAFLRDCENWGHTVIKASQDICVIFGNIAIDWNKIGDDGRVRKYNACFIAQNGQLVVHQDFPYPYRIKTLQPNYREFDDTRHFFSLRKLALELGKKVEDLLVPVTVAIGNQSINIGCLLCEDGWCDDYSVKPMAAMQANWPVDLFVNISSSPFTIGKNNKRNRVFSKQAKESGVPLIYVNNVGLQNNGKTVYTFDGFSTVYNGKGEIIDYCSPFTPVMKCINLDLASNRVSDIRATVPDDHGIEVVCQSLEYGVQKFLNLIKINKVVIGVSGGIDSAVSAALFSRIIPPENLLLVNMPSIYNSQTTQKLASELAKNLGCLYSVIPIQNAVDLTARQITDTDIINYKNGTTMKLSVTPFMLENIQARDRSSRILAGVAAAFGGGFTCNANKSELTVGYATLYGDIGGFLAALADLWKYQVYELANHLNRRFDKERIIPAEIFTIVPSAELSFEQSIEAGKGDPLVYPYHDMLFKAFMESWNRATPEDILYWYHQGCLEEKIGIPSGTVGRLFPRPAEFITDLERWWNLYSGISVAKRIQAPPILAVSRRAYGFDHREAQNGPYYTAGYYRLKRLLLGQ